MSLTDLEICKRIAEIECSFSEVHRDRGGGYVLTNTIRDYNPLTDDGLCFRLMVKYDINLTSMEPTLKDGSDGYEYTCYRQGAYQNVSAILSLSKNPNKAILLAIIEANKND